MSQDSWEDSVWAQDEPLPPESAGADGDHRGDKVQDQAGDLDGAPEAMRSAAGAVDEDYGVSDDRSSKLTAPALRAYNKALKSEYGHTRTEVLATRLPPYHPHPACRLSDVIVSRVSAQVRAWF